MSNFKLDQIESTASGLDAFLSNSPQLITPPGVTVAAAKPAPRVKVGSLSQLEPFMRLSAETLVHKSTQDLWSIKREGGEYFIERLFSEGDPLRG